MNENQIIYFRGKLQSWKEALLRGGDAIIHDIKSDFSEIPADMSDQASQEEAFTLALKKRDRERKLIHKIEEVMKLIDLKEYGYCEKCGAEIGVRRLEARPTATLCLDCKTLEEIREKKGH